MIETSTTCHAGAAEVDITPKLGTQLAGDIGRHRPARIVEEPIYAGIVVLEVGGRRCCIISMNVIVMTRTWADPMRRRIAERLGTEPSAVMLHATQNHAAPALGHFMLSEDCPYIPDEHDYLRGGDNAYMPLVEERLMEGVERAATATRPAWFDSGLTHETRVAFNRRYILRDGTRTAQPSGAKRQRVLQAEGPIDPEVGVGALVDDGGHPIALLLHHTCHPVHGFRFSAVQGSWPGAWRLGLKERYGESCVPLVLNGCCGNIHHTNHLEPEHDQRPETHGKHLTDKTLAVMRSLHPRPIETLDWRSANVAVRFRDVPREKITQAKQYLAEHPEPEWFEKHGESAVPGDWFFAVNELDAHALIERTGPTTDYEVQAIRLGDVAIVGVPGEPYVECQLRMKAGSPARHTFVGHYSNDYIGYVPIPEAIADGSTWETRFGNGSKLAPEALAQIADHTVSVLHDLFGAPNNAAR